MQERIAPLTHRVGKREVVVDDDHHYFCEFCGEVQYIGGMLEAAQRKIAATIRRDEGLLTPEELRAIRLKYGLTQSDMERLLGIGPKTWIRWERGKVVQSAAADGFIRLIARNPETLRDLLAVRGISNSAAEEVLSRYDDKVAKRIVTQLEEKFPNMPRSMLVEMAKEIASEVRKVQHEETEAAA